MEQEKIVFKNLFIKHMSGYCREYASGTFGNIIHWIYVYSNLNIADTIQVGENKVYYLEKELCEFYQSSMRDMPIFNGFDKEYKYIDEKQDIFLRQINNLVRYEKQELFKDVIQYMSEEDLKLLDINKNKEKN